jgi:hypothetical protein
MRAEITGQRLTSLFRPQTVALVGASDRSTFSRNAYENPGSATASGRRTPPAGCSSMRAFRSYRPAS